MPEDLFTYNHRAYNRWHGSPDGDPKGMPRDTNGVQIQEDQEVEVVTRFGHVLKSVAGEFDWGHIGDECMDDIIGWRFV